MKLYRLQKLMNLLVVWSFDTYICRKLMEYAVRRGCNPALYTKDLIAIVLIAAVFTGVIWATGQFPTLEYLFNEMKLWLTTPKKSSKHKEKA